MAASRGAVYPRARLVSAPEDTPRQRDRTRDRLASLILRYPAGVNRPSFLFALFAFASLACEPAPPVKTASGERIASVSYEERFPLSNDAHETTLHSDRLRRAVEMMDRAGVTAMTGNYEATGVLDKSTLVLTVTTIDRRERKLVVKNCAEPHVCAFFAEAVKSGVAERLPVVCRDALACVKK